MLKVKGREICKTKTLKFYF